MSQRKRTCTTRARLLGSLAVGGQCRATQLDILAIPLEIWAGALAVCLIAGIVKGMVGFAMPTIMISGMASFAAPELALAALILPTLMANLMLAMRGGLASAVAALKPLKAYFVTMMLALVVSAQIVPHLPSYALLLAIGIPTTLLTLAQLVGWRPVLDAASRRPVEWATGTFAGTIGGIGGVWGPPTVLFLTAIGTSKGAQLKAQGALYFFGAIVLLGSHLRSGILNERTIWFSAAMLVPAFGGMLAGLALHDRMDQERFRTVTLVVLLVAGLNLIRRGLAG